jgi:predicted RecB family endonuclease
VLTAFFKLFYEKETHVVAHPLTESGASPKEIGDIDLKFKDGRAYAVEVKAKAFSETEVNHACEKAFRAGIHRVIFAFGPEAEKGRWHEGALVNLWAEKGVELTFFSIEGALAVAMAASDACIRVRMAEEIALVLNEINAADGVKAMFRKMFSRENERE